MTHTPFSWPLFAQAPIVGIIRGLSADDVLRILPLYREAGLTTIEITMNTDGATDLIRTARQQQPDGLNVGAGTVCTLADLEQALDAGAQFIVTPILDEAVIKTCVARQIPIFPGAFTPTEVFRAWTLGASMVKVFPTTLLGPDYIRDLKAPLNQVRLLPTGGVSLGNMAQFFRAGAEGVGVGSQLFDKTLLQARDWDGLRAHFRSFADQLPARSIA